MFENDKRQDLNAFINETPIQHRFVVHMIRIGKLETYYPRKVENQKYSDGRMIITPLQLNMDFGSNNNHSDNVWSSLSGFFT